MASCSVGVRPDSLGTLATVEMSLYYEQPMESRDQLKLVSKEDLRLQLPAIIIRFACWSCLESDFAI